MDSLILLSEVVVYCDELDLQELTTAHEGWTEEYTLAKCRVLRTIKGGVARGRVLTIRYGSGFRRHLMSDADYYVVDKSGRRHRHRPKMIPRGRALVFLKRNGNGSLSPLSAKLIQDGVVLQFGQFRTNPGPMYLAAQKAENIPLTPGQPYGEKEFLRDVDMALEKAKLLKGPVRLHPYSALR